jgi:MFS family permease
MVCSVLWAVGLRRYPYVKVISRWFDRRRGLALGLTMFGIGSGAILMPALAQRLIAMLGWRSTYMVIGLLVLVVSVPVVAFFLKESPEEMGLLPDGAIAARQAAERQNTREGLAWSDARRSKAFWLMVGAIFLVGASVHGCVVHLVPLLSDQKSLVESSGLGHVASRKCSLNR